MFILKAVLLLALIGSPSLFAQSHLPQEALMTPEMLETANGLEIIFSGNKSFSSYELWSQMLYKGEQDASGRLLLKRLHHPEQLEDELARVRQFLGEHSFLFAQCELQKVEIEEGYLKLYARVSEGLPYRIGKIAVTGARYFLPERIIEISSLRSGEFLSTKHIYEGVCNGIKLAYQNEGYSQVEVYFEPEDITPRGSNIGIINIMLEVDEGRMFRIRQIGFIGHNKADEVALRNQLLLQPGSVFRYDKLIASLENLNALGLYESLSKKDFIVRTNDKDVTVDIDIEFAAKDKQ